MTQELREDKKIKRFNLRQFLFNQLEESWKVENSSVSVVDLGKIILLCTYLHDCAYMHIYLDICMLTIHNIMIARRRYVSLSGFIPL